MTGVQPGEWGRQLLRLPLRQPTSQSCGAAVLVVAEALRNDGYARGLVEGFPAAFEDEVRAMHRRTTSPVDVRGAIQVPWSRWFGTPPWAIARQLRGTRHRPHAVYLLRRSRRRLEKWRRAQEAVRCGTPVPVIVGSWLLPRHVLLLLAEERAYDPAVGTLIELPLREVAAGRLSRTWPTVWGVVAPVER